MKSSHQFAQLSIHFGRINANKYGILFIAKCQINECIQIHIEKQHEFQ